MQGEAVVWGIRGSTSEIWVRGSYNWRASYGSDTAQTHLGEVAIEALVSIPSLPHETQTSRPYMNMYTRSP